jgi:hypothetical protein
MRNEFPTKLLPMSIFSASNIQLPSSGSVPPRADRQIPAEPLYFRNSESTVLARPLFLLHNPKHVRPFLTNLLLGRFNDDTRALPQNGSCIPGHRNPHSLIPYLRSPDHRCFITGRGHNRTHEPGLRFLFHRSNKSTTDSWFGSPVKTRAAPVPRCRQEPLPAS